MTALASEFPDIELSHMYVDNAAMQLIRNPKQVCFSIFMHCVLSKSQEDTLTSSISSVTAV